MSYWRSKEMARGCELSEDRRRWWGFMSLVEIGLDG